MAVKSVYLVEHRKSLSYPLPSSSNRCSSASERSSRPSLKSTTTMWTSPSDLKANTGLMARSTRQVYIRFLEEYPTSLLRSQAEQRSELLEFRLKA